MVNQIHFLRGRARLTAVMIHMTAPMRAGRPVMAMPLKGITIEPVTSQYSPRRTSTAGCNVSGNRAYLLAEWAFVAIVSGEVDIVPSPRDDRLL